MNTHHVFYNDAINEGIGLKSFDTKEAALDFINSRLAQTAGPGRIENYTLISGTILPLEAMTVITKVRVDQAKIDAAQAAIAGAVGA